MNEKSFIDFPFSSNHQHLALVPIYIRYLIPDSNADDTLWNESFTFFRFKFVIWKVLIWAQSLYRKFSFFFSGRNFDNSHFKRRKKVSIISKTSHPKITFIPSFTTKYSKMSSTKVLNEKINFVPQLKASVQSAIFTSMNQKNQLSNWGNLKNIRKSRFQSF